MLQLFSGVAIAYFGMQNISPVTIRLNDYVWDDVPLYLVICIMKEKTVAGN